jgi:hypothetical protein
MTPSTYNVVGLLLVMAGVLILFRYGMPYRVRRGGQSSLLLNQTDTANLKQEKLYGVLGWIGLAFVVAGTACQIIANVL